MFTILLFVLVFLILSAFFSASETGLTSSSKAKIHRLKMEGNKRAEKISELMGNKDRLITTILLGSTFVITASSALVTTLTIEVFKGDDEAVYVATFILSLIILVFTEVLPKIYAFKNSEKVALLVAPLFSVVIKILFPITFFVEHIVQFFSKLLKLDKKDYSSMVQGIDAIRGAIELHHEQGDVIKEDKDMLGGILDLEHIEVSEIMKHRRDMETININLPKKEFVDKILKSPYSRIPVFEENPDNIIGVLHGKTLMRSINIEHNGEVENIDLKKIIVEPQFIPDSTSLKDQLISFRNKKSHFALVVDEYGSLLGLITLEDILEEIVGNIEDETDVKHHTIEEGEDGSFFVKGSLPIRDLNREMNWDLPTEEANTIAGLIIYHAEMIPSVGQIFNFFGFRFEILKKKKNQILKIKISV